MNYRYEGSELELFAAATNWKRYFASICAPFIGHKVLEVGAGIGANIPYFWRQSDHDWLSVEPDPELAARIERAVATQALPRGCRVVTGTIDDVDPALRFDSVLYIDVLEHIEDDAGEVIKAASRLSDGGRLVILSPAHQYLFSPFDAAVGHHRRYSSATLNALRPPHCRPAAQLMLDSVGFFASVANKALYKSSSPTPQQIAFWDSILVPTSTVVDRLTGYRFGKSIVVVWEQQGLAAQA
jgi:SAM-dependent methyltransferase